MRMGWMLAAAIAATLSGCGIAPKSGPTAGAVAAAAAPEEGEPAPYALAPLDARALDLLDARRRETPEDLQTGARVGAQRLQVGDVVAVTIWEAVDGGIFSSAAPGGPKSTTLPPQRIGPSGAISVPYAGRIPAAGTTLEAVSEAIARALAGKAIEPQVLATLVESPVSTITVVGDAARAGGRVPLADVGERVLDVLAAAGGAEGPAHATLVRLTRGESQAETHLARILREPAQNVRVKSGDVISVLQSPQTFTVFGAAAQPTRLRFSSEVVTLDQALAEAGGLDDSRASPEAVFVFRYEDAELVSTLSGTPVEGPRAPMVYNLDMTDPSAFFLARRFEMEDGDIIYAANAPLADAQKVLRAVATALTPLAATLRLADEF